MSPGRIRAFYTFGIVTLIAGACAGTSLYVGCGDAYETSGDGGGNARENDSGIPRDATFVDGTSDAGAPSCDGQDASFGAPTDLACTGLYAHSNSSSGTSAAGVTIASDVRAYVPELPAFTGGESARFIHVPDGARALDENPQSGSFPVGFKAWQEISVDGKRTETRFLWKRAESSWVRAVYAWNDEETRAVAITSGRANARGTSHAIPEVASCDSCHSSSHPVLGLSKVSLAEDDSHDARAWLHANCAGCHDGTRANAKDLRAGACISMGEARTSLTRIQSNDPLTRMPPFKWLQAEAQDPRGAPALQRAMAEGLFPASCKP